MASKVAIPVIVALLAGLVVWQEVRIRSLEKRVEAKGDAAVRVRGGDGPKALESLVFVTAWWPAKALAAGAAKRQDRSVNGTGFRFAHNQDPGEEPIDGVQVFNPFERVQVSEAAFDRLMARLLGTLVDGAQQLDDGTPEQPWWPEFQAQALQVQERAQPRM